MLLTSNVSSIDISYRVRSCDTGAADARFILSECPAFFSSPYLQGSQQEDPTQRRLRFPRHLKRPNNRKRQRQDPEVQDNVDHRSGNQVGIDIVTMLHHLTWVDGPCNVNRLAVKDCRENGRHTPAKHNGFGEVQYVPEPQASTEQAEVEE